ncbi:RNA polymerase sigma-70 factor [Pedobacter frigoris]|uniref:RNA polymerase sigma-70 factor n=1 Tax=Pedobacter frigoris TaxID=2571272 RepID=UPI00293050D8|nr:RNA polymerase sigma-70 factor [Pedobacter frigoris]
MITYRSADDTDERLMELISKDDRMAFNELYNRHWKFLFTSAFHILKDRDDSLDICQAVFIWLWEHRKEVNIRTNVQAYLWTSVKYKIANFIRNGKVRDSFFDELKQLDASSFQQNELEVKELRMLIEQLIGELPEKCQTVFKLSRNEQLSHKEIAERLSISEKTVDDHITRALKKLRGPLSRLSMLFMLG